MTGTSQSGTRKAPLVDTEALRSSLADGNAIPAFKAALERADAALAERFHANEPVDLLVHEQAAVIDAVICTAWHSLASAVADDLALVAVGGYGRGELHPHSDIDLMVLLEDGADTHVDETVGRFLTFLWDIGLEVGHSVRTLHDCETEAARDVTVVTTLMETRLLSGSKALFDALHERIRPERIWPSDDFFAAKVAEQTARHHRYHDTAYNLEPNIKGSPGGLRDIQMICWVAQRHLGTTTLEQLVEHGFLTQNQLQILLNGRSFLWRIRFALHLLAGRRKTDCSSIIKSSSRKRSATKTPPIRSASSSSCSATIERSWSSAG